MNDSEREFTTPQKNKKITSSPFTHSPIINQTQDPGIQRRLSDILVSFHKCVQLWETNNQASFNIATTLCNLYSQWWYQSNEPGAPELSSICKRQYYIKLAQTRESLLAQLKEHQHKLKSLYEKMRNFTYNVKAIYFVALASNNKSNSNEEEMLPVIFLSWTSKKFFHTIRSIMDMYAKEYILKQTLYQKYFDFRLHKEEDSSETGALSSCLSIWLHQPYIESKIKFLLDSMLLEAELK